MARLGNYGWLLGDWLCVAPIYNVRIQASIFYLSYDNSHSRFIHSCICHAKTKALNSGGSLRNFDVAHSTNPNVAKTLDQIRREWEDG